MAVDATQSGVSTNRTDWTVPHTFSKTVARSESTCRTSPPSELPKTDRGNFRKHVVPNKSGIFWFADLIVDTTLLGLADGVASVAPAVDSDSEHKPTIVIARIGDALAGQPDGLSQRVLCDVVTGKTDTIRLALSHLIAGGYVTAKTPHKLIRPYLDDSDSDGEDL
jgi:hypothetical protein